MVTKMSDLHSELQEITDSLDRLAAQGRSEEIQQPIRRLKDAVKQVGESWSGSWMGYHATVYYKDFQPPPSSAKFSKERG